MSAATMTPELQTEVDALAALTNKKPEQVQKTLAALAKGIRVKASASAEQRFEKEAQKAKG